MKILFLTNIPAPYRVAFFAELSKYVELTVIYELENAADRDKSWQRPRAAHSYREIYLGARELRAASGWSTAVLQYLTRDYDYIIVGTHGTPVAKLAMLYMRLRSIPYVLNVDGMLSCELVEKGRLNKYLRSLLFAGATHYLTSGEDSALYLTRLGVPRAKVDIYRFTSVLARDVAPTLPTATEKAELRRTLGITEERVLISVGSFIPRKGFDLLLKAKKMLPSDIGYYIIGGDMVEDYLELVQELRLKNVHFLPFMPSARLREFYRASDVFALLTRHDEWALVVNEAMAQGLPIITTDACGAGLEIVADGVNGYVVAKNDYQAAAARINAVLADSELRQSMTANNLAIAHSYTIENMALDHVRLFNEWREAEQ